MVRLFHDSGAPGHQPRSSYRATRRATRRCRSSAGASASMNNCAGVLAWRYRSRCAMTSSHPTFRAKSACSRRQSTVWRDLPLRSLETRRLLGAMQGRVCQRLGRRLPGLGTPRTAGQPAERPLSARAGLGPANPPSSRAFELAAGEVRAASFLIDMNRVFEDFVVVALREALGLTARPRIPPGCARPHGFMARQSTGKWRLEPDISWWDGRPLHICRRREIQAGVRERRAPCRPLPSSGLCRGRRAAPRVAHLRRRR